jgi:hypothetical protein
LIELRNRGKKDVQDEMVSAKNRKNENKFGTFKINLMKCGGGIQGNP